MFVGMNPGPWQGYPVQWFCLIHNMLGFYSKECPSCVKERTK